MFRRGITMRELNERLDPQHRCGRCGRSSWLWFRGLCLPCYSRTRSHYIDTTVYRDKQRAAKVA